MRVAIVTTSYPRNRTDPSGHFVESEARRLAGAGHQVTVIAPGRFEPSLDGVQVIGLQDRGAFGWPGALARIAERPMRLLGAGEFALRATRALRAAAPLDRVVAHFLVPAGWPIATRVLAAMHATELEVVAHGSDARLVARLPDLLRRRIVRDLRATGARVRFVSSALAALLPELAEQAVVQPSPIDVDGVPGREQARRELLLAGQAQLALVVARLIPGKNVDAALRAIALVPQLEAVVVGEGPLGAELARRHPSARFLGRLSRPDCLRWIAASDVLVSASRDEGAPTAIREARALGVPVVSVEAGDLASWAASDRGIWVTSARSAG